MNCHQKARVNLLLEALRFYAAPESWISEQPYISAAADLDVGDKARAAIAAFGKAAE